MKPAHGKVRIRRVRAEPLLPTSDVDDLLDAFAVVDADVVRVDVVVPEEAQLDARRASGVMRKVIEDGLDDGIEELTDDLVEGWEDDED
jgi:hypothetical protein